MDNQNDNALHQAELLLGQAAELAERSAAKTRAADELIQAVRYAKPHAEAISERLGEAHLDAKMSSSQADNAYSFAKASQEQITGTRPLP